MKSKQTPTAASMDSITLDTLIEQDSADSLRVFLPTVGLLTMIETVGHLGADDPSFYLLPGATSLLSGLLCIVLWQFGHRIRGASWAMLPIWIMVTIVITNHGAQVVSATVSALTMTVVAAGGLLVNRRALVISVLSTSVLLFYTTMNGISLFAAVMLTSAAIALAFLIHGVRRRALQENLKRLLFERELERAARLERLSGVVAGFAHHFNNTLAATLGATELALDTLGDDHEASHDVRLAHRSAKHAGDLIGRLQVYAGEQFGLQRSMIEASRLVDIDRLLEVMPPDTRINVIDRMNGRQVDADQLQLGTLLMELARNAAHAIRLADRPGVVDITLYGDPGETRIAFRDNGAGMSADVLDRAQDPFYTTGVQTGLGLSIASGIARRHGGSVRLESEPDVGTTVTVNLPTRRPEDEPSTTRPAPFGTYSVSR